MPRLGVILVAILAITAQADAGAIVHLAPASPGPYAPGQTVDVAISLESEDDAPHLLRGVQWDLRETDASISWLGATFTWDLNPPTGGIANPAMPVPNWASLAMNDDTPDMLYLLPADGLLTLGSVNVVVNDSGWLDVLNRDYDFDINGGGRVTYGFGDPEDPIVEWLAYDDDGLGAELSGGRVYLAVPEPGSLVLISLAGAVLLRRNRS